MPLFILQTFQLFYRLDYTISNLCVGISAQFMTIDFKPEYSF